MPLYVVTYCRLNDKRLCPSVVYFISPLHDVPGVYPGFIMYAASCETLRIASAFPKPLGVAEVGPTIRRPSTEAGHSRSRCSRGVLLAHVSTCQRKHVTFTNILARIQRCKCGALEVSTSRAESKGQALPSGAVRDLQIDGTLQDDLSSKMQPCSTLSYLGPAVRFEQRIW